MGLRKIFLINMFILMFTFMVFNPGFTQVKKEKTVSFPGVIENVDKDFKFIVVNEARILLSATTKIVDEKGNAFKISDLKPKVAVTIEAIRNPDGFLAERVVVKTTKRKL